MALRGLQLNVSQRTRGLFTPRVSLPLLRHTLPLISAFLIPVIFTPPLAYGQDTTPAPSPSAEDTAAATLILSLVEAGTRDPLRQVKVLITTTGYLTYSDLEGTLRIPPLPEGTHLLQIESEEGSTAMVALKVEDGEAPGVLFVRMDGGDSGTIYIDETRDDAPVAERRLQADEIRYIPGSLGDAVRAVQNLPGVAWAPLSLGLLIVRGTNPEDSGYFMDGLRIPQVFHFLGLTTVVNSDFLESVRFLPGGFGVRYGRVLGGVIDLETKDAPEARHHGYASVDLLTSSIYASGPINEDTGYVFSVRRSYMDKVFKPVLDRVELDYLIQLPRFYDYQVGLYHQFNDRHRLRVMTVGVGDSFAVFGEPPADADPDQVDDALFDYRTGLNQVQVKWDAILGDNVALETVGAFSRQPNTASFGSGLVVIDPTIFQLRSEARGQLAPRAGFRAGLDLEVSHEYIRVENGEGDGQTTVEGEIIAVAPAPYIELSVTPFEGLNIVPGIRMDPLVLLGQPNMFAIDPRIAARYSPRADLRFKGALGLFSGFPTPLEYLDAFGTPELTPEMGIQSSGGFEVDLPFELTLDTLGYFNWYRDLVVFNTVGTPSAFDVATGGFDPNDLEDVPMYINGGQGAAYGLEVMLRRAYGEHLWGWVSYTLQRSVRRETPEDDWRLYDFDQTHLLTLVGVKDLAKGWRLGGRFRYASGALYTPAVGRSYNVDSGSYSPLYGEINSDRYPDRVSIDVRGERLFTFDRWSLSAYLEVQNATNHQNVEAHYYSWDYENIYYIAGLPILPTFGLQGRW